MKNHDSFAQAVKEEIAHKTYKNDRLLAMISSFTHNNGSLVIKDKKESIVLKIENPKIAKFIYGSFKQLFNEKPNIAYLKNKKLNKNTNYVITISDHTLIEKLHIHLLDNKIDSYFKSNNERIAGYLTGSFLASGSVNSPRTSNYHLENSFNNEDYAIAFIKLLERYEGGNFTPKIIKRRDKFIVYLKRVDQIQDFLVLIGANEGALYLVDATADRDIVSNANRLKNLDTANYAKTIKASQKDINILKRLIKKNGLMNLGSEKAVMLASLRIKYPEDSLENLAEKMSKELGVNVSKSNINHLLRSFRLMGNNL